MRLKTEALARRAGQITATAIAFTGIAAFAAVTTTVYNSLPSPTPPDYVNSLGYAANSVLEFGALVQPSFSGAALISAEIGLSNFATCADNQVACAINENGYTVPMTLNLYNVNPDGSVGSLAASSGLTPQFINWNPNVDGGNAQVVQFNFSGQSLPGQFVYGLSFATTGSGDPVDSLNLGFTLDQASIGTTVDPTNPTGTGNPDVLYVNTLSTFTLCGLETTCPTSAGTLGVFGPNPGWNNSDVAFGIPTISFQTGVSAVPEPATFALLGLGLVSFGVARRRKKA